MSDIYVQLRDKLDEYSTGYPTTESGVELSILHKIFIEEEADLYLKLSSIPETPDDVAERLNLDKEALAEKLEEMAQKGQLMRIRKNNKVKYCIVPYLVGIMEFQVKRLEADKELALDMARFGTEAFVASLASLKTPHQRSVPINQEIMSKWPIAPFDDAYAIVKKQKKIAVANCVCRTVVRRLTDANCDKALESCLVFGLSADYYVENGLGRYIDEGEAIEILKKSDEDGLVIQPLNAKHAGAICSCCGDCCGMLMSLKMQPKPAESVYSSYYAVVDIAECVGCEACIDRCQMDAVKIVDERAEINLDRCIGCGLCVTTCPPHAMSLMRKPEEALYDPPETHMDMYIRMGKERGKI